MQRPTTIWEKLGPSILNVLTVLLISLPVLIFTKENLTKKLALVTIFFLYELACMLLLKGRDLGMVAFKTHWKQNYDFGRLLLFNILYTLSFATLVFYIWVPFDLFLINIIILQLPALILSGKTFHGFLSNVESAKNI